MSRINVEELLAPVSPETPAGDNLEYDASFGEMERAAVERVEQEFGETVVEGQGAAWKTVEDRALDLLARSKDVRAAVYLARSAMHTGGVPAFVAALAVVRGLLERFWETVHPALDEDGPLMRVNALGSLADADATLGPLRRVPLVSARALGSFSLRDVEQAQGGGSDEGGEGAPSLATIDGAFLEADIEQLETLEVALVRGREHVAGIEAAFSDGSAPALKPLDALLGSMHQLVAERLARRGVGSAETGSADSAGPGVAMTSSGSVTGVNSREDVIRALDLCCAFYERHEPSSPVPILLRRAKRLVSKGFLEILRDLVPDGVSQAEALRGPEGDD